MFSSVKIIFSFALLKYFLFCETFHYFITATGFYFFPFCDTIVLTQHFSCGILPTL